MGQSLSFQHKTGQWNIEQVSLPIYLPKNQQPLSFSLCRRRSLQAQSQLGEERKKQRQFGSISIPTNSLKLLALNKCQLQRLERSPRQRRSLKSLRTKSSNIHAVIYGAIIKRTNYPHFTMEKEAIRMPRSREEKKPEATAARPRTGGSFGAESFEEAEATTLGLWNFTC